MMKNSILLAALFFAALQYCNAQTDSTTTAARLIQIEQQLNDGLPGDSALWAKYLDPKWYIVDENGNGLNRKDFLQGFGPFPKNVSGYIKVINPVLTFHGDIVVVHYIADEHENYYGNQLHTTYGTMNTWYKTDTSWMMLGMQSFEIPALPPSIKVAVETLKLFTGTYRLSDSNTAVITLKNDTLFLQKNQRTPTALLPETANVFFRKEDARGRKIFVKDNSGQMLMLERRNGQDVIWKRIK
jgi:hypothetical protein